MKTWKAILIFVLLLFVMFLTYVWENYRYNSAIKGLVQWHPPTTVENEYKDVCRIANNCATKYNDIKWYISSDSTLNQNLCGKDKVGCFITDKKSIIINDTTNIVVLRHELMHAAWADNSYYFNHHCKYFNIEYRTWWYLAC